MSDNIKISERALRELKLLTESKAWQDIRKAEHAKSLRGEVTANWLDSFMNRMYQSEINKQEHLVNAKTGKPHTVESMVQELRERVQLDSLTKSGKPTGELPLSKKMAEQMYAHDMQEITKAIENFLSSHRGHADDQAVLYFLRDTFGEEHINKLSDQITKKIEQLKKEYAEPLLGDEALADAALGQPLKLEDEDLNNDQIFTNIQDGLGRK